MARAVLQGERLHMRAHIWALPAGLPGLPGVTAAWFIRRSSRLPTPHWEDRIPLGPAAQMAGRGAERLRGRDIDGASTVYQRLARGSY